MGSERLPARRWFGVARSAVAGLLAAGLLVALMPAAQAQQYDRRARPPQGNFFNPFQLFSPLFQQPQQRQMREPRDQRAPRMQGQQQYAPNVRTPVVSSGDASKAPPPRKPETPPSRNVVVFGSSLADWLAYGLEEAFEDRPDIGIVRKDHPYSGLIKFDSRGSTEWPQYVRDTLKEQNADVVVMLIGLLDRQSFRPQSAAPDISKQAASISAAEPKRSAGPFEFRTEEWAAAYSARIDQTIAALKSKGVPVIWVGLPAIRGTKSTSDMIYLNDLFRARAEHANIVYVDVWDGFVDDSGHYSNYGPDVEGQVRRLRTGEGVYFTKAGAAKLAHYVEREINRLIGTKLPQVATAPSGEDAAGGATVTPPEPTAAAAPATPAVPARPVAGPVVSLTGTDNADALAGANPQQGLADPLARRVLVKGDAVVGPRGRADNFFLTPEAAAASAAAAAASAPAVAAAPKVSPPAPAVALARPETPESSSTTLDGGPSTPEIAAPEPTPAPARSPTFNRPPPKLNRPAERRPPPPPNRATAQHIRPTSQQPRPAPQRDPRTAARRQQSPPSRAPGFDPLGLFR